MSDKERLELWLAPFPCDRDFKDAGPPLKRLWACICYASPGCGETPNAVFGMTPIKLRKDGEFHELGFWDMEKTYGDWVGIRHEGLGALGYVRIVCPPGTLSITLGDKKNFSKAFRLDRDLFWLPPEDRLCFIVRVETGEVYPEYYGANWENYWRGSRHIDIFPYYCARTDKKYMLGEQMKCQEDSYMTDNVLNIADELMFSNAEW